MDEEKDGESFIKLLVKRNTGKRVKRKGIQGSRQDASSRFCWKIHKDYETPTEEST